MRAIVHDRYGPPEVLRLEDVPRPEPKEDELLVRVHATTVTQTDCHMRRARPFIWRLMLGLRRPKRRTLGLELAGVVEAVGPTVTEFAVGDRVFGMANSCHAEYVRVKPARVADVPAGASFEEAGAVCDGFHQGLTCLRAAKVREGQRILVYGASGACGTACVQLARYYGAHITAVCRTKDFDLVRSLGADVVIDYMKEDFSKSGETWDVVIDAVGKRRSFLRNRRSLRRGGVFVPTDGPLNLLLAPLTRFGTRRMRFQVGRWTIEDLLLLKQLMEAGQYRAVIDRTYPLEDVVEAMRYVESWQKTGNVVITMDGGKS